MLLPKAQQPACVHTLNAARWEAHPWQRLTVELRVIITSPLHIWAIQSGAQEDVQAGLRALPQVARMAWEGVREVRVEGGVWTGRPAAPGHARARCAATGAPELHGAPVNPLLLCFWCSCSCAAALTFEAVLPRQSQPLAIFCLLALAAGAVGAGRLCLLLRIQDPGGRDWPGVVAVCAEGRMEGGELVLEGCGSKWVHTAPWFTRSAKQAGGQTEWQ